MIENIKKRIARNPYMQLVFQLLRQPTNQLNGQMANQLNGQMTNQSNRQLNR